jgi:hypothetical protein
MIPRSAWHEAGKALIGGLALLALFLSAPAPARNDGRDDAGPGFDPTLVEQWKESPTILPAPPPPTSRLLPVPLGPADTLRLYIDPASLSRLKDGVARLTLVIETASGVRNVFHDGFRCETRAYKTYAVGRADGTWLPIRNAEWRPVEFLPTNAYRHHLQKHLICDGHHTARQPAEIIRLIRYPSPNE